MYGQLDACHWRPCVEETPVKIGDILQKCCSNEYNVPKLLSQGHIQREEGIHRGENDHDQHGQNAKVQELEHKPQRF